MPAARLGRYEGKTATHRGASATTAGGRLGGAARRERRARVLARADATITVTPSGCQLPDAIQAAETGTAQGMCPKGDSHGLNTIVLTGGNDYAYTDLHITGGRITLIGHTAADTSVDGLFSGQILQIDKGATVTIENLTLAAGSANAGSGGGAGVGGGAVRNNGTLKILNSVFNDNASGDGDAGASSTSIAGAGGAGGPGGAVANYGSLSISGSSFTNNFTGVGGTGGASSGGSGIAGSGGAGGAGGAVASYGSLVISASSFTTNSANAGGAGGNSDDICGDGGAGGSGGAVAVLDGTATVSGSFSSNSTGNGAAGGTGLCAGGINGDGGQGAAVFNEAPSASGSGTTIGSSNISGNVTGHGGSGGQFPFQGSGGDGGGVANSGALTLRADSFENNTTGAGDPGGSGGGVSNGGTLTMSGDTLNANKAGGGPSGGLGGGLSSGADPKTSVQVVDSTITGNTTPGGTGAGVEISYGTVTLTASTVAGNSMNGASTKGSGIDISYKTETLRERDSLVASNGAANCTNGGGTLTSLGHNLSFPDASCGHEVTGDPKLGPLLGNGGPTKTMALGLGSAAIDKVPAPDPACSATTDQRGVRRPQGPTCDIGAFEVVVPVPHTKITHSRLRQHKHRITFRFKAVGYASGFECALIKSHHAKGKHHKKGPPRFSSCESPKTYRHLKPGTYTFLVRAFTNDGADPTPAKQSFTIT